MSVARHGAPEAFAVSPKRIGHRGCEYWHAVETPAASVPCLPVRCEFSVMRPEFRGRPGSAEIALRRSARWKPPAAAVARRGDAGIDPAPSRGRTSRACRSTARSRQWLRTRPRRWRLARHVRRARGASRAWRGSSSPCRGPARCIPMSAMDQPSSRRIQQRDQRWTHCRRAAPNVAALPSPPRSIARCQKIVYAAVLRFHGHVQRFRDRPRCRNSSTVTEVHALAVWRRPRSSSRPGFARARRNRSSPNRWPEAQAHAFAACAEQSGPVPRPGACPLARRVLGRRAPTSARSVGLMRIRGPHRLPVGAVVGSQPSSASRRAAGRRRCGGKGGCRMSGFRSAACAGSHTDPSSRFPVERQATVFPAGPRRCRQGSRGSMTDGAITARASCRLGMRDGADASSGLLRGEPVEVAGASAMPSGKLRPGAPSVSRRQRDADAQLPARWIRCSEVVGACQRNRVISPSAASRQGPSAGNEQNVHAFSQPRRGGRSEFYRLECADVEHEGPDAAPNSPECACIALTFCARSRPQGRERRAASQRWPRAGDEAGDGGIETTSLVPAPRPGGVCPARG